MGTGNMKNNIVYYRKENGFEYVYYQKFTQSYPMHTHANHVTLGFILDGEVRIVCDGKGMLISYG